jgi:uncharacterized protein YjbI with pentapeptide repeats
MLIRLRCVGLFEHHWNNPNDTKLINADLRDSNLTNADLTLTRLNSSIFNCESLRTANLTGNTNQFHIVDSNNKEVSSC